MLGRRLKTLDGCQRVGDGWRGLLKVVVVVLGWGRREVLGTEQSRRRGAVHGQRDFLVDNANALHLSFQGGYALFQELVLTVELDDPVRCC